jgi:hypothetical protein
MRKRQSFLLTILTPDDEQASFRGQIKVIANGKTSIFTSADELYRLISNELYEDQQDSLISQEACITSLEEARPSH